MDTMLSIKVVPKDAGTMADGQANEALRRFLADEYDVMLNQVEIVSGHTSTHKTVRIRGY